MEDTREELIFNNRIKLITQLSEFKMSLWVNGFGLKNAATDEEIIPLVSFFNLEEFEEKENSIVIKFRIYPNGAKDYLMEVFPFEKTFIFLDKTYHTTDYYKTIMNEVKPSKQHQI